jgi:acyl-homoserine lactone synthase
MIHIVNIENRGIYAEDLALMHQQRKAIFIDRLRWNVAATDGLEIDAYDRDDTIYLLAYDSHNRSLSGSARLLPTLQPHLMSDLFAHTCDGGVQRGARIWEASRFCPAPTARRRVRIRLLWSIFAAVMESSLLFGIEQVVFTANAALLPLALGAGWQARRLGPTMRDGRDSVTAIAVDINLQGLHALRERFGIDGPVTRFVEPRRALAA